MSIYDTKFYNQIDEGALRSANIIIPQLIEQFVHPLTVIDIGCGTGAWLKVFKEHGAQIHGVDFSGDGHQLIDESEFEQWDLTKHFIPDHKYDLAISLEVAEHLDEEYADVFVNNVARCSDNILWSAAVPGQRGLHHVNEQFPSYWIPKFERLGYKVNGDFRLQFWYNEEVENWYRQNVLLFTKMDFDWNNPVRDLIHYNNYPNYGGNVEERFKYND